MANYFAYYGVGGSQLGNTSTPTGGTIPSATEVLVCQTTVPDNRISPQNGVLIDGFIEVATVSAASVGTFLCRQSVTGTTAITGSAVGTVLAQIAAGTNAIYRVQFVDATGTFPLPAYQITANFTSGTASITQARVVASPLGE